MATSEKSNPDSSAAKSAASKAAEPKTTAHGESDESPVTESTKSGMAAALERKQAAANARGGHMDGNAKVGGATENHKATRTFRRKSG